MHPHPLRAVLGATGVRPWVCLAVGQRPLVLLRTHGQVPLFVVVLPGRARGLTVPVRGGGRDVPRASSRSAGLWAKWLCSSGSVSRLEAVHCASGSSLGLAGLVGGGGQGRGGAAAVTHQLRGRAWRSRLLQGLRTSSSDSSTTLRRGHSGGDRVR